jgi:Zn-dependent peptidase ImmA (M78 family)/transcriptional regulator with XRE-family HTH domain
MAKRDDKPRDSKNEFAMARTAQINPQILSWARETAGLTIEEAAEKLGLKDVAKASAAEKLAQAEAGTRPVTQTFLEKVATTYRRPLLTFYLPQPPARGDRGEDFRTISGTTSTRANAMLDALLRDVRARQQMLREILAEDDDARPLTFVASVGVEIRATLGVTIADQRRPNSPADLFANLRGAAERAGIYVLLLGDLGSYHSDIGEDVFRGFALADDLAPIVVINDNDAAPARSFTLIHELAHLWLGASGVSGPLRGMSDNAIERLCNAVASEFLLPPEAIGDLAKARGADFNSVLAFTATVARDWNVSQGAVAYRLTEQRLIAEDVANELFRYFAERWRAERQRARDTRDADEAGPSYYVVRRSRLGTALLGVVRRALQANVLTHTKAGKILGVKPTAVDALLQERPQAA